MTRFEMDANYVDVLKPRKPHEKTILRFKSGHGVIADIVINSNVLKDLIEKLEEAED